MSVKSAMPKYTTMPNKVMLSTESRMRGDMQVRFGGRYGKTYCRKAVRRPVPSLRAGMGGNIFALAGEFIGSGDFITQARYVAEVSGMPLPEHEPHRSSEVRQAGGQSFENVEILPLQNLPAMAGSMPLSFR